MRDYSNIKPKFDRNKHFVLQCRDCHNEYELLNPEQRLLYWKLRHFETYQLLLYIMS